MIGLRSPLCALLVLSATIAGAVDMDVNIEGVYTDTTFSAPVPDFQIDTDRDLATVTLAAGQGVHLSIDVANPAGDLVEGIFSTIVIDGAQLEFLSGFAVPEILVGGPIFAPTSLFPPKPELEVKINSPNPNGTPGEVWVQAIAYLFWTAGVGPDLGAVDLFFEVTGASGDDELGFHLTRTQGDVWYFDPANTSGAVINLDSDDDSVPDAFDNCRLTPNADQRDEDSDGHGTACDCDFLQDGFVLGDDLSDLFASFNTAGGLHDITGDGFLLGDDVVICFSRFNTVVGDL